MLKVETDYCSTSPKFLLISRKFFSIAFSLILLNIFQNVMRYCQIQLCLKEHLSIQWFCRPNPSGFKKSSGGIQDIAKDSGLS